DVPLPDQDPFYAVPGHIAHLRGGKILRSRAVATFAGSVLPMPARAWQVQYKSLSTMGRPTADVATILVPTAPWQGRGRRPLVSYQTAEDGVGSKCSPSYALRGGTQAVGDNSQGETAIMRQALGQGMAIVAPDYEGPRSAFLGAAGQADAVLDGIRAALAFNPAGLGPRTPIAMWGYSGGSIATVFAATAQRRYAPNLHFAGIALGGLVTDARATLDDFANIGGGGAIIVGLVGINRAYPSRHLTRYLSATARRDMANSQTDCLGDAIAKYPGLQVSQVEAYPGAIDSPGATAIFHLISPWWQPGVPAAPIYDYHATGDEFAPISGDRRLMHRFCNAGVAVEHVEAAVGEHISEVVTGAQGVLDYLTARFNGQPAPNNCATIPRN
ncbi:MAG: hypothetical protein QOG68_2705, partial [Solirubrobacteraceae bacterium]|nr:hypothetical protein [Solirubrobacteraceae bacterium]